MVESASGTAWLLMGSGLVLILAAAGMAVRGVLKRQPPPRPSAPTLQPHPPEKKAEHQPTEHAPRPLTQPDGISHEEPPSVPPVGSLRTYRPAFRSKASAVLPTGVGPHAVLEALALSNASVGRVLSTHLWLLDENSKTLRLVSAVGEHTPDDEPVPVEGTLIGRAVTSGTAVFDSLPSPTAGPPSERGWTAEAWRFAVPVSTHATRGVAVVDLEGPDPDRETLAGVVSCLRSALSAALAIHVSDNEAAAASALVEAAAEIVRLVDPQAIIETSLDRALSVAHAQTGSVMLADSDGILRIRAARGLPPEVVTDSAVRSGDGIAGVVWASGAPLVIEDLAPDGARGRRHGIRSAVSVPIASGEEVYGVLNVGNADFPPTLSSRRVATVQALGSCVAIALRNARALAEQGDLYLETVRALALAVESADPYSRGAAERTYALSLSLGAEIGLAATDLGALGVASLLHDIGMSVAGDSNAAGTGPLTTVEHGAIKLHPAIAAEALGQSEALRAAVPLVYHHHERFDGTGYVLGLAGTEIPLGARVLAVADAFVSMTSPRPYRCALTEEEAYAELEANAGTQFDPDVVSAFTRLTERSKLPLV